MFELLTATGFVSTTASTFRENVWGAARMLVRTGDCSAGHDPALIADTDVPMTMRLLMVGAGQQEMNRTQAIFDWQRGFSLERGRLTTSGHALRVGTHTGC